MIRETLEITNRLGLHARAAAKLVRVASSFKSDIKLGRPGRNEAIDGKSILGILFLAAGRGSCLQFRIEGEDEDMAMAAIRELFKDGFEEFE